MKNLIKIFISAVAVLTGINITLQDTAYAKIEDNMIRTIAIDSNSIDCQSMLEEFDSYQIDENNGVLSFSAEKRCAFDISDNIDYVSDNDIDEVDEYDMQYEVELDLNNSSFDSQIATSMQSDVCNFANYEGNIIENDGEIEDFEIVVGEEKYYASDIIASLEQDSDEDNCGFTPNIAISRKILADIIDVTITVIALVCAVVSACVALHQALTISKGLVRNILKKSALTALKKLISGPLKTFLGSVAVAVISGISDILGILFDFSIGGCIAYAIDYFDQNRLNGVCFG